MNPSWRVFSFTAWVSSCLFNNDLYADLFSCPAEGNALGIYHDPPKGIFTRRSGRLELHRYFRFLPGRNECGKRNRLGAHPFVGGVAVREDGFVVGIPCAVAPQLNVVTMPIVEPVAAWQWRVCRAVWVVSKAAKGP